MTTDATTETAASPDERLVLVDGNNYIWRAFHAIPPRFRPDGLQVNAVYGFVAHLLKRIIVNGRASHVAIVFDHDGPCFRREIFPDYKANRPPRPEELTAQLPLVRAAAEAFAVVGVEAEGFEADDLIASYTRAAVAAGLKVSIVTSDKDLMQLIDDRAGVSIYDPQKQAVLREAEAVAKFGVPPAFVPDVQALAGDAVDGVPGVRKIGLKIGAQLIRDFGNLEELLTRTGEIPQAGRRKRLEDEAEMARLSFRLVTLRHDAPLPVGLERLRARAFEVERVRAFLDENAFQLPGPWA